MRNRYTISIVDEIEQRYFKKKKNNCPFSYLILIYFCFGKFFLALILKRDDDQSDENVNEEKWKYDEINNVKNCNF